MATSQTDTIRRPTVEVDAPDVPATIERPRVAPAAIDHAERFGLQPRSIPEWLHYCRILVASGLVPDKKEEQAFVRIAKGVEMGLTPLAAAQWVYTVPAQGGQIKLGVMAEGKVAVVLASGAARYFRTIEKTATVCTVETWRRGEPEPQRETFTIEQARQAGLLDKDVWKKFPTDMLYAKAAGRLCSRVYADILSARGVVAAIDADDDPPAEYVRHAQTSLDTSAPAAAPVADPDDIPLGTLFARWQEVFPQPTGKTKAEHEALRAERIRRMGELIGRPITSWNDLTAAERKEAYSRLGVLLDERKEAGAAEVPLDPDGGAGAREPGDEPDLFGGAPRRVGP
ncbi:MAG TPA: hypothetical protein VF406_04565 [Thermodesulfobacteriota bacterium]